MKEYHEILGLEEGASQEEIQVAYENLSNKLNPNNNNNDEDIDVGQAGDENIDLEGNYIFIIRSLSLI